MKRRCITINVIKNKKIDIYRLAEYFAFKYKDKQQ